MSDLPLNQIVPAIERVGYAIIVSLIAFYFYWLERKRNAQVADKVLEAFTNEAKMKAEFKAAIDNLADVISQLNTLVTSSLISKRK